MSKAVVCHFFILSLLCTLSLRAQTDTWRGTGSTDLWSNSANWNAGAPAGTTYQVLFDYTGTGSRTADLDIVSLTVDSLVLESSTSGYDLISSSGQTLTIGSPATGGSISTGLGATET